MRFEALAFDKQIKFLEKLYEKLNREFFDNSLPGARLDIVSVHTRSEEWKHGEVGVFKAWEIYSPFDKTDRIAITYDLINAISSVTQRQQLYALVMTLLHEMVHQYWHRVKGFTDNSDANHPQEWQDECTKHGLYSIYDNGVQQSECLSRAAEFFAAENRIREYKS